jgi:hypothetical protein
VEGCGLDTYGLETGTGVWIVNTVMNSEISGSHGAKYEDECLLGCCAV